eukprot:192266_1
MRSVCFNSLLSLFVIIGTIAITWNLSYLSWNSPQTISSIFHQNTSNSLSYLWKVQNLSPSYHDDYWKLYCLTTSEHCIPMIKCNNITEIRNFDADWAEKISTCLDFLDDKSNDFSNDKCLIYSVGIQDKYNWDITMARDFGCEVHSFDPTVDLPTHLSPNVTFHKWGLRGPNINGSASQYKGISGEMLLLSDIIKRLGHEKRKIDIIRMDCEGCEWEVLSHDKTQKILCDIPQILTEFHYSMPYLPSVKNLTLVSKVYDFLNHCNFKEFHYEVNLHDGPWDRKINKKFIRNSYFGDHGATDKRGRPRCCREYGFLKH